MNPIFNPTSNLLGEYLFCYIAHGCVRGTKKQGQKKRRKYCQLFDDNNDGSCVPRSMHAVTVTMHTQDLHVPKANDKPQDENSRSYGGPNFATTKGHKDTSPERDSDVTCGNDGRFPSISEIRDTSLVFVDLDLVDLSSRKPCGGCVSHLVDEDGNEFHGLDNGGVHEEHGEQRISGITAQKHSRVRVATPREIPINHDTLMISI